MIVLMYKFVMIKFKTNHQEIIVKVYFKLKPKAMIKLPDKMSMRDFSIYLK